MLDSHLMEQCGNLGRAIAQSVGKPYDEVEWIGEEGICPVCHCNQLSISPTRSAKVECPVCGISGDLELKDNKIEVKFSEEQINRARWTINGLYEHYHEIQGMIKICVPKLQEHKDTLPKMLEKYEKFDEFINQ